MTRNVTAGPMAEHEAERLQNRHQTGNDTGRRGLRRAQAADKICIGQIIDGRHQHRNDRRNAQTDNQAGYLRLRHLPILCFRLCILHHKKRPLFRSPL